MFPPTTIKVVSRPLPHNSIPLSFPFSSCQQSLARQLALSSDSTKPHHIFEGLSRSDVINCQHSMVGLIATSFAEKAALWQLYGKTRMATLASLALLQLNSLKYGVLGFFGSKIVNFGRNILKLGILGAFGCFSRTLEFHQDWCSGTLSFKDPDGFPPLYYKCELYSGMVRCRSQIFENRVGGNIR